MNKPFSQACENNRQPILNVLRRYLPERGRVLEIGAGTGQHAVYFAAALPNLLWQATDQPGQLAGIEAWRADAQLDNLPPPLPLDVDDWPWPVSTVDAVYSANTAHIMAWPSVQNMLTGVARILVPGGLFCLYGPFNRDGEYTSASNARFDQWLRTRDPHSGLRDRQAMINQAAMVGLEFVQDEPMPANNQTLIWRRSALKGNALERE